MWLPDVIYLKLILNLLLIGLGVWLIERDLGESIEEPGNLIAMFSAGTFFVIFNLGYLWLSGDTNVRSYALLIEIGVRGQLIVMGYAVFLVVLVGLVKKLIRVLGNDA